MYPKTNQNERYLKGGRGRQRYDTIETTGQYIALTYYNFCVNSKNWEKQYENCSGWMIHKEMRDKITTHRWKGFAFYLLVSACASLCQINKLNAFKFMPSSCQFPQDVQNVSSFLHRTTQLNVKPNSDVSENLWKRNIWIIIYIMTVISNGTYFVTFWRDFELKRQNNCNKTCLSI